jgi:hypothetical protein
VILEEIAVQQEVLDELPPSPRTTIQTARTVMIRTTMTVRMMGMTTIQRLTYKSGVI